MARTAAAARLFPLHCVANIISPSQAANRLSYMYMYGLILDQDVRRMYRYL